MSEIPDEVPRVDEDHDQRFKSVLREFIREFFAIFFPKLAEELDFTAGEWLPQELFPNPPQGTALAVDLLLRVPLRSLDQTRLRVILLHIEIESADRVKDFRRRMFEYWCELRKQYPEAEVVPIALYLRVANQGKLIDEYRVLDPFADSPQDSPILRFRYRVVPLAGLKALDYLEHKEPLASVLSVLMKAKKAERRKISERALERVQTEVSNADLFRRLLLTDIVQTYGDLPESSKIELISILNPNSEGDSMRKSLVEHIRDTLEQRVRVRMLEELISERFGSVPSECADRLRGLPPERLPEIGRRLVRGETLEQLGLLDPVPAGQS